MVLPDRLWRCAWCKAEFIKAWRMKRHLMLTHGLSETKAWEITDRSEYFLRIGRIYRIEEDGSDDVSRPPHQDGRRRTRR